MTGQELGLRGITVCVDFADVAAVTLPRMLPHFKEAWVVTATRDTASQEVALTNNSNLFVTDSFWDGGAAFNKWKALELGLDAMGRHGVVCLFDVDVIWPKIAPLPADFRRGKLLSPLRRMLLLGPTEPMFHVAVNEERVWKALSIHRNVNEHAGYTQIFHADDPALGPPPWHEVDYTHAGAADSWFQRKWATADKIRPAWEVLHLGQAGENWMGRATPHLDGSVPADRPEKLARIAAMWAERRERQAKGLDPYAPEKLNGGMGD